MHFSNMLCSLIIKIRYRGVYIWLGVTLVYR